MKYFCPRGIWRYVWLGLIAWLAGGLVSQAELRVSGLRCEYRTEPLGLDTPQPRLSWQLESRERGQVQTAYQVIVAAAPEDLTERRADLWDSGKVVSNQSFHVAYAGKPLHSGQRVYWKVRAWDKEGRVSAWSRPASWEMALLTATDWQAQWITRARPGPVSEEAMFGDHPAPLYRKEFGLQKKIRRARAYVSGLGYYELFINGKRVGDQFLDPGWTAYGKRVLYSTYDVTPHLRRGQNAVGAMLGNGWFNPLPLRMFGRFNLRQQLTVGQPRLILQLVVEFTDGTTRTVVTDPSWKVADGPVLQNNVYLGEVYDARLEQSGWANPGFDDSRWEPAMLASEPLGPLQAQDAPPIRATRSLKTVAVTEPKPGVYIFDLGQNYAGWVRLRVAGPAGTRVRLRYGELLHADGTLNAMTSVAGQIKQGGPDYRYEGVGFPKTAFQVDQYILRGRGEETYTPRFTFHGLRYVEVTGFPGKPGHDAIEGLCLNADVASAGSFACSSDQFNRIQEMVRRTELSNLFSVQSDCPHREKLGYGGDILATSQMAMLNFDMGRFYAKAVVDLVDAARPNGGFTETAPFVGIADSGLGDGAGPIGWGSAEPVLQAQLYRYYGDRRLLEEQFAPTKRWFDFLKSCATNGILDNGISDHESLVPKPRALTGTAFYYLNVKTFAQLARILGRDADASEAESLAQEIKAAFNNKFLQPGTGRYDTGSQACQAFALHLGLVPESETNRALAALVQDIREAHQGHLTTGIFGTKFMLEALTELGCPQVAYEMVNQRTFPGWGYMLEKGATTLSEHWEFSDNTYSHNHPMFGSVSEWFFKCLGGIAPADDAVGFDKVIIRPQPAGDLTWAKASYDSIRGKLSTEWHRSADGLELRVRIPVGVTALVMVPARNQADVSEGGKPLAQAPGVKLRTIADGRAVLNVGSGDYLFRCRELGP